MKIAVCLKQVPDTVDLRLDPRTNTLIREGMVAVLNPLDAFPLEAGLRLRQSEGGTVSAITMGPPSAEQVLHKAIAMGSDNAVLLSDRAFAGSDTWSTSLVLARAIIKLGGFDLVLCGKQAVDGDTAQVGPGIAAHLDWPQVTYVTRLEAVDGRLRMQRLFDNGTAVVEVAYPVVATILKQANEPRLPSLAGRGRAYRTRPTVLDAAALGLAPSKVGLEGSPTQVSHVESPEIKRGNARIKGSPKDCAAALLEQLKEYL